MINLPIYQSINILAVNGDIEGTLVWERRERYWWLVGAALLQWDFFLAELDPRTSLSHLPVGRVDQCGGRMQSEVSPSARIDEKIKNLGDWRGKILARMRGLIHDADPEAIETVKWAKPTNPSGVPTWEHAGIICTGEVYKTYVKLTFAHGAALEDPTGLFNAGFGGGTRRAIDIREGATVDAPAFKALVKEAVALNLARQEAKRS